MGSEVEKMLIVDSCVFIDTFDPPSHNHYDAVQLLETLLDRNLTITMPAHGWFEIWGTLKLITSEKKFVGPIFDGGREYPIELIHIDKPFIEKYTRADIPYIKAGDHIFVAMAKTNDCPLITSDAKMIEVSKKCGVRVFKPAEFMNELG